MNWSSFLWITILLSLAISPAFALGAGNRNLFLIVVMAISPIIIITYAKISKSDLLLLFFMGSIVLFPLMFNPESMRWSTVFYSMMFGLAFIAYKQLLYAKDFSIESYQKILKYLIYAYFIMLLIQQICVLIGLPIINISNYDPVEPWKLNSLAAEPSHSARIVPLFMYCYILIKELIEKREYNFRTDIKEDKWIWLAFLWTMVTMGSGTAFLFIAIVLLKFIKFRSLVPLLFISGVTLFIVNMMGITATERTFKVIMATLTFDTNAIIQADHSASIRIVPIMFLSQMVDLTTLNGLFGHGIDSVSIFLRHKIPGVYDDFTGGGLLALWIEYGFLSFIFFVLFVFSNSFRKGDYMSIIFLFFLVFLNSVNSQIVWLTIVLLFTNKYFYKKLKKDIK